MNPAFCFLFCNKFGSPFWATVYGECSTWMILAVSTQCFLWCHWKPFAFAKSLIVLFISLWQIYLYTSAFSKTLWQLRTSLGQGQPTSLFFLLYRLIITQATKTPAITANTTMTMLITMCFCLVVYWGSTSMVELESYSSFYLRLVTPMLMKSLTM